MFPSKKEPAGMKVAILTVIPVRVMVVRLAHASALLVSNPPTTVAEALSVGSVARRKDRTGRDHIMTVDYLGDPKL